MKHAKLSQIIKVDRDCVFKFLTDYDNALKSTKMFKNAKVIERNGDQYKVAIETKFMGKIYKAILTGTARPYVIDEKIVSDDGSIIKDHMELESIAEGTRLNWSGEILQLSKLWRIFGPIMKFFFDKSISREFKRLAKTIEEKYGKTG